MSKSVVSDKLDSLLGIQSQLLVRYGAVDVIRRGGSARQALLKYTDAGEGTEALPKDSPIVAMMNDLFGIDSIDQAPPEARKVFLKSLAGYVKAIEEDPFSKHIEQRHAQKLLSDRDYYHALQEDQFYQAQFAIWQALGIERLYQDAKGKVTGRALSLDDIRQETLFELERTKR